MLDEQTVKGHLARRDLLTHSRLKAARLCQRYHKLRFIDGYKSVAEAEPLRFGTLLHKGLEAWWRASAEGRLEAALTALEPEADPFDRAKAKALIYGYHARWADEPYETVAVEQEFVADLVNPDTGYTSRTWRLAGKIDVLVSHVPTKRKLIVEHKTSSEDISQGSSYWRRLLMDGQVSIYFQGGRSLGHDVAGCLYDVIGKPGQRPLKATPPESRKYTKDGKLYAVQRDVDETPGEYFARVAAAIAEDPAKFYQRGEVTRLDSEIVEAVHDIWQTGKQIRESELAKRAPRNSDACLRYGRPCEMFDVCSGTASLDDETRFVKLANPFPELNGEKET